MRPFFPYYGSKWNLVPYYPSPNRDLIVEPFAGSAAYATRHGVEHAVLIDQDPVIVATWEYLIGSSAEEVAALPELPNAGDTLDDYPDLEAGAQYLIGFWLNRGSAVPKRSRTAYSARADRSQLNWGPRAKERIIAQLPRIAGWIVGCGDYMDAPDREATWFVDPPYVDKGRYYRVGFDRHDDLGEWVRDRKGQVIVCEGAEATWLPFVPLGEFKTSRGAARELVWTA